MPAFDEEINIYASPEFVWGCLTDTNGADGQIWPGVHQVGYQYPGEPLTVGQRMGIVLAAGDIVLTTCSHIDAARYELKHTIDQAPFISRGWLGIELEADRDMTVMQLRGEFKTTALKSFGAMAAMPLVRSRLQRIGHNLSWLAAQQQQDRKTA